jgi:carbamoylphosphate synthase small subunit
MGAYSSFAGTSLEMTRDGNVQIDAQVDNNDPDSKLELKLLLVDHNDSFTYNLADMLAQICARPLIVLAADSVRSWAELRETYDLYNLDGIILSLGPGNPVAKGNLLMRPDVPILCAFFGHQIWGMCIRSIRHAILLGQANEFLLAQRSLRGR